MHILKVLDWGKSFKVHLQIWKYYYYMSAMRLKGGLWGKDGRHYAYTSENHNWPILFKFTWTTLIPRKKRNPITQLVHFPLSNSRAKAKTITKRIIVRCMKQNYLLDLSFRPTLSGVLSPSHRFDGKAVVPVQQITCVTP